jgi:hypothetical protein
VIECEALSTHRNCACATRVHISSSRYTGKTTDERSFQTHGNHRISQGSLGLEVGTHGRTKYRVERGGIFDREMVTRVPNLGYEIRPKFAKWGEGFFQK